MKTLKKVLGVVLAIVMLANVFAMGVSAAFPDDTAVKLMLSTDKTTYAPGDTVIVTISEQVLAEVGAMTIGGQYEIAYPSSVIAPIGTSNSIGDYGVTAIQDGYDAGISGVQNPASSSGPSANSYGWDKAICYGIADNGTTFAATEATDLFTVTMKISETAADGTYTIGFNPAGYEEYNAYSIDGANGGLYGTDASMWGFSVKNLYEFGTCSFTVSSAEPSPVYAKGSQIRFNGTEADGAKANFDVRTRAALKAEDFAAICKSEDNAKVLAAAGKLQVGFVYTAGTMDVATAKAVATGTAADGYYNKPVTYIQSTGTEYVWTCLIKNADYNDSVQALGYIIVDGTAYYFDAASTTTFSTLYDAWYDDYTASLS